MRTIVVIGGSKGIGKAIVERELAVNKVVSISRTPIDMEHTNLTHYSCDVLSDDLPEIEHIDSLVYCPGSIRLKPFKRMSSDDFTEDFQINVLGAIKVIQHYLPFIDKDSKSSSILLFSTVAVKMGMPFHTSVATAKGALEGFAKSLAADLAPTIRVNVIAPTLTDTELASRILRSDKMKEINADRHPLKKYLHPNEVAGMASFLLSESAAAMSGQVIEMDCGIVNLKI
ncbi:MAG: SDR family NAD(P)-dependent oxidoreductase [Flavicella sp.]